MSKLALQERLRYLADLMEQDDEFSPPEDWEIGEITFLLRKAAEELDSAEPR